MALNIILICLVAVSALNLLLICDLYGRSARLVVIMDAAHKRLTGLRQLIEMVV